VIRVTSLSKEKKLKKIPKRLGIKYEIKTAATLGKKKGRKRGGSGKSVRKKKKHHRTGWLKKNRGQRLEET